MAVEGQAGDAIFFHQHLVHGSSPNHSPYPRPTFINRYTKPEDAVIMPLATSVAMRQEALAGSFLVLYCLAFWAFGADCGRWRVYLWSSSS